MAYSLDWSDMKRRTDLSMLKAAKHALHAMSCAMPVLCTGWRVAPVDMSTCYRCGMLWEINQYLKTRKHHKNRNKETAMESITVQEFLSVHPAELTTTFLYTDKDQRRHYECTLTITGKTPFTFPFTCGSAAGEPTLPTVLECLMSDAQIGENYTMREFLKEFSGDKQDMLTDINAYAACQETARHLRRLFSSGGYEELLTVEW